MAHIEHEYLSLFGVVFAPAARITEIEGSGWNK
jgi:hypothetical protein